MTSLSAFFLSLEPAATNLSSERKRVLAPLVAAILDRQKANEQVLLNFICTHNSRRSHIAQLLAAAAALEADLENIDCFSGGTEITRIHPNALEALEEVGFQFEGEHEGENPHFLVDLGEANLIEVFSKTYDDELNPSSAFIAVMVCGEAEKNCPYVSGADLRISVTYDDPKNFDNEPKPVVGYLERCREIGSEMLYVMQTVSAELR